MKKSMSKSMYTTKSMCTTKSKAKGDAPGSAVSAGNQSMDVRFSMKPFPQGKKVPGKVEMDISPFNEKPKNLKKISPFAKTIKK